MWRIALSERITDSLVDVLTRWSIDDAADAHDALDYLDALHDEMMNKK